jgi:hypothetical protein
MFDLRTLFDREARARRRREQGLASEPAADSDYHPSTPAGSGLEVEYHGLIATQMRRMGIRPETISIEVRPVGKGPHGFDVLVGLVRLHRWDRVSALRVLVGLPLLEAKVRKVVRGSWLADFSYFGGLWLHASEQVHAAPGAQELRELLRQWTLPDPPTPQTPQASQVPPAGPAD